MEVAGSGDDFARSVYQPSEVTQAQTVIIPLTRRTEELIGSMYSQFVATAPPLSLEDTKQDGTSKPIQTLSITALPQTNNSSDIKPTIPNGSAAAESSPNNSNHLNPNGSIRSKCSTEDKDIFTIEAHSNHEKVFQESSVKDINDLNKPYVLGGTLKPRRNLLEPIATKNIPPPPSWSFAKGYAANNKAEENNVKTEKESSTPQVFLKNGSVPASRAAAAQEHFPETVSSATLDLFSVHKNK